MQSSEPGRGPAPASAGPQHPVASALEQRGWSRGDPGHRNSLGGDRRRAQASTWAIGQRSNSIPGVGRTFTCALLSTAPAAALAAPLRPPGARGCCVAGGGRALRGADDQAAAPPRGRMNGQADALAVTGPWPSTSARPRGQRLVQVLGVLLSGRVGRAADWQAGRLAYLLLAAGPAAPVCCCSGAGRSSAVHPGLRPRLAAHAPSPRRAVPARRVPGPVDRCPHRPAAPGGGWPAAGGRGRRRVRAALLHEATDVRRAAVHAAAVVFAAMWWGEAGRAGRRTWPSCRTGPSGPRRTREEEAAAGSTRSGCGSPGSCTTWSLARHRGDQRRGRGRRPPAGPPWPDQGGRL